MDKDMDKDTSINIKTVQEYEDEFFTEYENKIEETKREYVARGENVKDKNVIEEIVENSYEYFLGDEYNNSHTIEKAANVIVGMRLIEMDHDPKKAYNDYMNGYEYNKMNELEKLVSNTLFLLDLYTPREGLEN